MAAKVACPTSYSGIDSEGQLVGKFAEAVQERMCERLAERRPGFDWETERSLGGTPVDVVGIGGTPADVVGLGETPADVVGIGEADLVAIELEWRRADPADNTAKLFRYLSTGNEGVLTAHRRVVVVQVFTAYYDLASGGVSSKRKNAEFVGRVAQRALESVTYHPVKFDLDPPKRGGEWPSGWREVADETVDAVIARSEPL